MHPSLTIGLGLLLIGILGDQNVQSATITGNVRAQGKPGADADAQSGKYDSHQFKFLERVNYAEMHDFIVFIDGPVGPKPQPPDKPAQVVTSRVLQKQKGAMFSPHVLPIVVGTTVEWPNHDEILHNVFSVSESNPFNLGLYKSPKVERWTFENAGRVDVFCSIHTRMSCIVLVLQNPWFAATNAKGDYTIKDVPPGVYKLKAWHERLPSQIKDITISEAVPTVKADFILGFADPPKP